MNSTAGIYGRGTANTAKFAPTTIAAKIAANTAAATAGRSAYQTLNPNTDANIWMQAMNALLFLTADLGPSINA